MISDEIQKLIESAIINGDLDLSMVSSCVGFAELIDKLTICNLKLFKVKDLQADLDPNDTALAYDLIKKDIALCKERSLLKGAIDMKLLEIVKEKEVVVEQKVYGG